MTKLRAKVPESLYDQVAALAERERISVDALVAMALNAQVAAWLIRDSIAARARRGELKKFDRGMGKIRSVKPAANDRL
ncbi:MAG TPA: hypothetical protein VKX17_16805 [Planctomycetota bacterium]|nr:hypothetical protein [Planctomycetota bacterium]